jgi:hypothetical protein
MSDLSIVIVHGKTFVGRATNSTSPEAHRMVLVDALELQAAPVQTPRGLAIATNAFPISMLASLTVLPISDGAIVVDVDSLSKADRRTIEQAVDGGRRMVSQMRASQAGILVPQPGAMPGATPANGSRGKVR